MTERVVTSNRWQALGMEFLIGLFFLFALFLLVYFTAFVDGKELFGANRNVERVNVAFPSVANLSENDRVCVKGMRVGRVESLAFGPDCTSVIASLRIDFPIPIYSDYMIEIRDSSVFGGRYVEIEPGTPSAGVADRTHALSGGRPQDILNEASLLIRRVREDQGRFRELVLDSSLIPDFRRLVVRLDELAVNASEGKGTLGLLLHSDSLYRQCETSLQSLDVAARQTTELAGRLNRGEGTLGKLLTEPDVYDRLTAVVDEFHSILRAVREGNGSLSLLLNDGGSMHRLCLDAFESVRSVADQLQEGKGTLGLLIQDDRLHREMLKTLEEIHSVLGELRERHPVTGFGSLFFGPF